MNRDVILRHAAPLPRYTSYPTANHFGPTVAAAEARVWLERLPDNATLSLYLHIPFCRALCLYCGCTTKATRRYAPVADYLAVLGREIDGIAERVPAAHRVTHIHWGGGSPDILTAEDIVRLGGQLRRRFKIDPDAEFAVEIDPRLLSAEQADAFERIGVNRASIGVQDFDPAVQQAIGREQGYETTARAVALFRDRGVASLNLDLVYGLPRQSEASVTRTLEQVLALAPDRVAIFGYAHLPSRLKHQRLIDEARLPGPAERYAQARRMAALLIGAGYVARGLDHFARPDDKLARGALFRNFQGYTTDSADALLGLGASAISHLPDGFAQNAVAVGDYAARLESDGLATARGRALTVDDRVRAFVIERLMCDFAYSAEAVAARFGPAQAAAMSALARAASEDDADGFLAPTADGFRLTPPGMPFVRTICARFDAYLPEQLSARRHALSV